MDKTFKIHPAIGIARLGNNKDDFYITPESAGGLPIVCDTESGVPDRDEHGVEQTTTTFKDDSGRIKRWAARFRVYATDEKNRSREVAFGETLTFVHEHSGQIIEGELTGVEWTAYVANKKAIWYEFKELSGEHGYLDDHPLRNADVAQEDQRRQLIIDPGPQTVDTPKKGADGNRASFTCGENPNHPQSFPPALNPNSISTLGGVMATRDGRHSRLLVLAGHGNSGSALTGLGEPKTTSYANNDGWFDDIADGPVGAKLVVKVKKVNGKPPVPAMAKNPVTIDATGAWVVTAYPAYLPQIENIIRLDETIYDMSVREMAYDQHLYDVPPFEPKPTKPATPEELAVWREKAVYNPEHKPWFWRDIWPILRRPQYLDYLLVFDPFLGAGPHSTVPGQNFDPGPLSVPPSGGEDRYRFQRYNIYNALRKPGQENVYKAAPDLDSSPSDYRSRNRNYFLRLMPELCGDNPISNTLPSKFLSLTRTMLFLLKQWAEGRFSNEFQMGWEHPEEYYEASFLERHQSPDDPFWLHAPDDSYWSRPPRTPTELDRGALANGLGGSFCPGGEVTWIVRNPAIYQEPFRFNGSTTYTPGSLTLLPSPDPGTGRIVGGLSDGLEPGDVTKYNAVPWQTDFNECAIQGVDITYENFLQTSPRSTGDPFQQNIRSIWWWPTHRPLWVMKKNGSQVEWTRGIPATDTGDMMMVQAWSGLGFIIRNDDPDAPALFYETERNPDLVTGDKACPPTEKKD